MKTVAAILAAGSGARFGGDKTQALLGGKPVWRWSFDILSQHPRIEQVFLVCGPENADAIRASAPPGVIVGMGGSTRTESSRLALDHCGEADVLLLHDAARPFLSADLVDRVLDAVVRIGAAAPGVSVPDTIRQRTDGGLSLVDRSSLYAMQTPQGGRVDLLRQAHLAGPADATDEMALLDGAGVEWELVPGEPTNFKITTPDDLRRAAGLAGSETRTGFGYDVHPFSSDPAKPLMLGGVRFNGEPGLEGHSDADVILHAAVDAILGAAALGDIGQHFPNTDPRWKGEPSLTFLRHASSLVSAAGWRLANLDVTVIAEKPKIMPRASEIRAVIAAALGVDVGRVSVKATTNEGLGALGRGEGIAAHAIATLSQGA